MKASRILWALLTLLIPVSFASCGGGTDYAGGGIGGTGISVGKVTAFGSVWVNGIEYFTTGDTTITKDGVSVPDEKNLQVGMIVTVHHKDGTATRIEYKDNLEGPVQSVDLLSQTLVVVGQTVIVDGATVFEPTGTNLSSLSDAIATGNPIVEVSGFVSGDESIHASYIELKGDFVPGIDEIELKGTIKAIDTDARTFQIGSLSVDYSKAELEVPGNILSNESIGLYVEVKSREGIVNGKLIASKIEAEDTSPSLSEGDKVEIEGLVANFTPLSESFKVSGQSVQITAQTEFKKGVKENIANGVKVEVEGRVENGVLVAEEVSFRLNGAIEIEADVESVDLNTNTVTLLGKTVTLNSLTAIHDDSDEDLDSLSLQDIRIGDRLAVRGYLDEGTIVATSLKREDPDDENEVSLKGPVDSVDQPNIIILGVTVQTAGDTEFKDIDEAQLSADEFFASVTPSALVKVKGMFDGTVIAASKVEIESR